jgi:AI-2 transport system ATP-binding protein
VSTAGILSTRKENELTDRFAKDLSLQAGSRRRRLANLSGGNQQKVSLAKALASNPSVIILDEPSRGVDVAAREDLYRLIDRMALEGLAVVLISSDFEEVVDLSHRVLVMRDGRIRGELAGDDISLRSVRDASFGSVREGNQS